jgi:hypothetical protein
MWHFDGGRVGQRLVPGGESRWINLSLTGSEDGNE